MAAVLQWTYLQDQINRVHAFVRENARLLDESRRYAAALKEADHRKDEFLAMLAHELRNRCPRTDEASGLGAFIGRLSEVSRKDLFPRVLDELAASRANRRQSTSLDSRLA